MQMNQCSIYLRIQWKMNVMVEMQVPITSINIGGCNSNRSGHKSPKLISVDQTEADAFRKLEAAGVELDLRVVATDPKGNFEEKLKEAGF